jgi:anti-anti-sigma regulatory factor
MQIIVTQAQGTVPVTVMGLQGDLDGSNYQDVIAKAGELYESGTRYLLVDLTDLRYMSSAGLVALHSSASLLAGQELPDPDSGWEALRSVDRQREKGKHRHMKLLSPQARVARILDIAGMSEVFDIYSDMQTALASF